MAVGRAEHAAAADELDLIERARTDPEAFATLYRRHVDRIHRFALRRTGDPDQADDITAATFEKALAGLDRFRPGPAGIAPWLHRIAGNELVDRYRRRGREGGERARRAADRMADAIAFDDHTRVDDADAALAIRDALDTLNPRYQRVLTLRYLLISTIVTRLRRWACHRRCSPFSSTAPARRSARPSITRRR